MSGWFSDQRVGVKAAFIGGIFVIIGAIIAGIFTLIAAIIKPVSGTQPAPTNTLIDTPTSVSNLIPTPYSGKILFNSLDNLNTLSADLQWEAGSSKLSQYTLSAGTINLVAGPFTWPGIPMINYTQYLAGDFEVQVKVVFQSPYSTLPTAQMAGLIIRPTDSRLVSGNSVFPPDWVVIAKSITDAGRLVDCRGQRTGYSGDTIYLRIERMADSWYCAYGDNGVNWERFAPKVDGSQLKDRQLQVALFAYSDTDEPITVEFADWFIDRK